MFSFHQLLSLNVSDEINWPLGVIGEISSNSTSFTFRLAMSVNIFVKLNKNTVFLWILILFF